MTQTQSRNDRIASLRILAEYYWIYLANLAASVEQHLGEAGQDTLDDGMRNFGFAEGQIMRDSALASAWGRNASTFLASWRSCDLLLSSPDNRYDISGSASATTLALTEVPGASFGADPALLRRYWPIVLEGMAAGFDEGLSIGCDVIGDGNEEWRLEISCDGKPDTGAVKPLHPDPGDAVTAVRLSRETLAAFSTLTMQTGQTLMNRFGAKAEAALREGLYNFGTARAKGMREDVLTRGKNLNFETWFEAMQRRDPNASAFVFRGDSRVSPGVFQVRCTYCPMAEAWAVEGASGLSFGQIYDLEVHRGLVEGFHPEGIVAWDKLKTRGDKVCDFRFSIPSLVTPDDPDWAQPPN